MNNICTAERKEEEIHNIQHFLVFVFFLNNTKHFVFQLAKMKRVCLEELHCTASHSNAVICLSWVVEVEKKKRKRWVENFPIHPPPVAIEPLAPPLMFLISHLKAGCRREAEKNIDAARKRLQTEERTRRQRARGPMLSPQRNLWRGEASHVGEEEEEAVPTAPSRNLPLVHLQHLTQPLSIVSVSHVVVERCGGGIGKEYETEESVFTTVMRPHVAAPPS